MPTAIGRRLVHFHMIVVRPIWAWIVTGLLGFASLLAFLRDEFLPQELDQKLKLLNIAPHWQWYWWMIAFLSMFICVVIEGSFRASETSEKEIGLLKDKLSLVSIKRPFSYVDLSVVAGPPGVLRQIELIYRNKSDDLLQYKNNNIHVDVNGDPIPLGNISHEMQYIPPGEDRTFGIRMDGAKPIALPFSITVASDVSYDNVPSLVLRTTKITVKYTFNTWNGKPAGAFIINSDELPKNLGDYSRHAGMV